MNSINKVFSHCLIATLLLTLVSCENDSYIYQPTNNCVSFENNPSSYSLDGTPVEVRIYRGVASQTQNVRLSLAPGSIYTLSASEVAFAANEYEKSVQLTYNPEELEPAVEYGFAISFDQSEVSPAGTYEFVATGIMPFTYVDYGTIHFRDRGYNDQTRFMEQWAGAAAMDHKLQIAKYTTTYFRIKDVLGSGRDLDFKLTPEGDFSISAPDTEDGYYIFKTPYKWSDGDPVTMRWDADPDCIDWWDYSEIGTPMVEGAALYFEAQYLTDSAGKIENTTGGTWFRIYFEVTKVN